LADSRTLEVENVVELEYNRNRICTKDQQHDYMFTILAKTTTSYVKKSNSKDSAIQVQAAHTL